MATNMASWDPEVISPKDKCRAREIVELLKEESLISLDSEGVQLGKDGPLTLLQIGTLDGHVYLFDVMLNEKVQDLAFFKDTGLDAILSSAQITKVIHSCSNDSAALYHQFGVHLDNIFDTQVAHLVIEEHKGRKLPTKLKLADICTQYSENVHVYEGKDDIKMKWSKQVGNFWAIRPMTDEMIGYASCDVTALIPEVHDTQTKYIAVNGLLEKYQERVKEERDVHIDPEQKDHRKLRNQQNRIKVLSDINEKYPTKIDFDSISEDEKKAIELSSTKDLKDSADKIKNLKQESMNWNMERIKQDLQAPENFNPHIGTWSQLSETERHGDEASKKIAKSLKNQLLEMVLDDINTKYTTNMDMDLEYLTPLDRKVLIDIRPVGDNGKTYAETILILHWKLTEKCLDEEIKNVETDPNNKVDISLGKLNFYSRKDEVPFDIQAKAKQLKTWVEKKILEDIEEKLTTPETFYPHQSDWDKLCEVERYGDKSTKKKAKCLKQELSDIVLGEIEEKQESDTDIESLNDMECQVLKNIRPIGDDEQKFSDTIVILHWKLVGKDLDEETEKMETESNHEVDISFGKLNFFLRNDEVPFDIQTKAKQLKNLKEKIILEDIEEKLTTPETFYPHQSDLDKLCEVERYGDKSTKKKAKGLKQELSDMVLGEIEEKQESDTDIESLNDMECQVLRNIRPIGDDEQKFSDTIVILHWKLVGKDLDEEIEKMEVDPNHEVDISFGKLNFFLRNDEVPFEIQTKAKQLKHWIEMKILEDIEEKLTTPETFYPHQSDWDKLCEVDRYGEKSTKKKARVLKQELSDIVLGEIEETQESDTDIESLNDMECQVLKNIRPIGEDEQMFSDTIRALHWKLVEQDIDEDIEKLETEPNHKVDISVGKLNFFMRNDEVPKRIRYRAKALRDRLVVRSIVRKYSSVDDVAKLSRDERSVIESLNLPEWTDTELIVEMYWRIEYDKLCSRFPGNTTGKETQMSEGLKKKLNFLKTHPSVPLYLKQKANSILARVQPRRK